MRTSIDRLAVRVAVALLCASLGGLLVTVALGFSPSARARFGWAGQTRKAYPEGTTIDIASRYYAETPQTLVLFVSGSCGATLRSASMLGQLVEHLKTSTTRIVVISPATRQSDQVLLARRMGVDRAVLVPLDLSGLHLRIVPSAVLVDRKGRVRFSLEGTIGLAEQRAILDAVARATDEAGGASGA